MNEYFQNLNAIDLNNEIKEYALKHDIPIISEQGIVYLMQLVRLTKAKKILEIGTAIGYSSICLAQIDKSIYIDTIERNSNMYYQALNNIKNTNLESQIKTHFGDALKFDENEFDNDYDLIFIDAAKAQYQRLFEKYETLLSDNGIIVCDNLLFHGLVASEKQIESKNLRSLISKIKNFNLWLAHNKQYKTVFLEIGDGMAVSERL